MSTDKTTRQNRVREALGRIYDQQPPYFREYLRRFQEDPTSRVFAPLAEAYRRLGRVDEAIEICREGLEHHPDFHGGRVAYAKCLVDKKQFADAKRELERVVYAVPENLLAQRLLGEVNAVVGDKDAALHAFKMALLLSPVDVALAEKVHQLEQQMAHGSAPARRAEPEPDLAPPPPRADEWQPSMDVSVSHEFELAPEAPPAEKPAAPREEFVQQNLQESEDPLSPSSSLESLLNESDEELGDDLAPLWRQLDEKAQIGQAAIPPPPKGDGHDDIFISEPISTHGADFGALDEEDENLAVPSSLDPVVDEGLEALLGRDDSVSDEPFKVEHVSEIFQEEEEAGAPQEITTETLGDLYFSQGQFERALRIFEKLGARVSSAELARKIQACKARLGVTQEQMLKNRQIEVLRRLLSKAKAHHGS